MEQLEITTKDLGALNELLTFENWLAIKMHEYSLITQDKNLKKTFSDLAKSHLVAHSTLLDYLNQNGGQE